MDGPTFPDRHDRCDANGFRHGQRVELLTEAKGADHEDIEHTIPPGADGIIECIEYRARPQGLTFTIWILVNEIEDRGIVNVFDESDGPISTFITAEENT
jgi:hypothetical protein